MHAPPPALLRCTTTLKVCASMHAMIATAQALAAIFTDCEHMMCCKATIITYANTIYLAQPDVRSTTVLLQQLVSPTGSPYSNQQCRHLPVGMKSEPTVTSTYAWYVCQRMKLLYKYCTRLYSTERRFVTMATEQQRILHHSFTYLALELGQDGSYSSMQHTPRHVQTMCCACSFSMLAIRSLYYAYVATHTHMQPYSMYVRTYVCTCINIICMCKVRQGKWGQASHHTWVTVWDGPDVVYLCMCVGLSLAVVILW